MNETIDDGGPAFPVSTRPMDSELGYGHQDGHTTWQYGGVTIRDYFAAKAMQGMLTDLPKTMYGLDWQENVARGAYQLADTMLRARVS